MKVEKTGKFRNLKIILEIIGYNREELAVLCGTSRALIDKACQGKVISKISHDAICYNIGRIVEWNFEDENRRKEVTKMLDILEPTKDFRIRA